MGFCILDWGGLGFRVVQRFHAATCNLHRSDAARAVVLASGHRAVRGVSWKVMTSASCPAGHWKHLGQEWPLDLRSGQLGRCLLKWDVVSLFTDDRLLAFLRWLYPACCTLLCSSVTHSRSLAWRISWTEEPVRLQSMGLERFGYDWSNLALGLLSY